MFRKILLLLIPNAENNITFQLRESSLKSSTARLRKLIRIGLTRINLRSAISAALTRSNRMLFSAFGISFILTLTLATQAEGSILEKKWEEDRTKIADSEQIKPQTQVTKPVRVYVDVVADLMHAGHVEFFKKAKSLGDYLIVGVLSDADVASYKRTPILTLEERVATVQACRYVDEVIAAPPMRVDEKWLKEHQIDFLVHGDDFDEKTMEWWYGAAMKMGIFRSVPYTKGISTTNIIKRIADRNLEKPPPQK